MWATGPTSAISLELLYRLLCACQKKGLSKIFKTLQVALCLAVSIQLCFIWVCLCIPCVCVSAWLLAKLFMPFPACLSESSWGLGLAQSFGLQSVFPGSALTCFTAFLVTLTLVSGLSSYCRRCFESWLFHFVLCLVSWPEMWGHHNLDLSQVQRYVSCWIPKYLPACSPGFEP